MLRRIRRKMGIRRKVERLRPARTHVIGCGTGKSGTVSLAAVFAGYRAAHEPDADAMIHHHVAVQSGDERADDLRAWLAARQRRRRLEVDVSVLNGAVVDVLVGLFPKARFVLTIREPAAYLASIARHMMTHEVTGAWRLWREVRFGGHEPRPEDAPLVERGLYPVDAYLTEWVSHNQRVLDAVPLERLLVVETSRITESLPKIAAFAGVPMSTLRADRSHSNPGRGAGPLKEVDPDYVGERVEVICAETWQRLGAMQAR